MRAASAPSEQQLCCRRTASHRFGLDGFYAALDGVRRSRGLTWRQIARETELTASSLTRTGQGSRPDVFPAPDPEPVSMVTAYIHQDRDLTPESASALEQLSRAAHGHLSQAPDNFRRTQE